MTRSSRHLRCLIMIKRLRQTDKAHLTHCSTRLNSFYNRTTTNRAAQQTMLMLRQRCRLSPLAHVSRGYKELGAEYKNWTTQSAQPKKSTQITKLCASVMQTLAKLRCCFASPMTSSIKIRCLLLASISKSKHSGLIRKSLKCNVGTLRARSDFSQYRRLISEIRTAASQCTTSRTEKVSSR